MGEAVGSTFDYLFNAVDYPLGKLMQLFEKLLLRIYNNILDITKYILNVCNNITVYFYVVSI